MIGTSREAVNKQLRDWEAKGFIDVRRGSITILDAPSLQAVVDDMSCSPASVAESRREV